MDIVVNADDFALEPIRDKAIVECFRRGWISQTTAVMNRPGLELARSLARAEGLMDRVGLHINLIYGQPVTEGIRRCPLFCDGNGLFNAEFHKHVKSRLYLTDSVRRLVAAEVRAQVDLYRKQGFSLFHADSHQHAHTDFAITPVIVAILKEEGFRSLRIARNLGMGMSVPNRLYKRMFNAYLRRQGMAFSGYFGSIQDYMAVKDHLPANARVELMCHPMFTIGTEDREDGALTDFYVPFDAAVMDGLIK